MSETSMKKQALLIGINQYEILPELKYARQDAEAVEQSLKYNYCFSDDEVMLLTDSRSGLFKPTNRLRILLHLDNLANQDLDLFIFGFWGHGVVRSGKRYLCPLDVSPDAVEQLGVPFDDLMDKLSKIRAKNTCLILDCCQRVHDGERSEEETFTAADQKAIENAARDIVLRRKEKEPEFVSNVAILNSCKEGQAAYEWDNRKHGIFTAHLLDAMNRRYDSVAQIVGYVSSNVEKTAKELNKQQTPLCSLEGDIPLPVDTKTAPLVTGEVFISYRHSNAALVEPIEEELKKRNISYFIDRVGVNYTTEYASAIAQAVKECKVLLFVWTQDADVSPDILREVTMALALKKRVLPYKIGTFNVTEHGSLFYQLSPISRFEVPKQTPETIVELVNQVQQALTGKTFQQYTFALPERSKDAIIEKPVVEEINVTFTPGQIERQQPIQYDKIQLPPLPEELIKIQAENKGRETAIAQLKDFTHESLAQANAAVAQAQAQFDAWSERKERLWKDLSKEIQQSLEETISDNLKCTEADIKVPIDKMSNPEYLDLLERFQCGKKYEQARRELERVQNELQEKCDDAIKELQQKIASENAKADEIRTKFMDEVLFSILAVMPGYENLETEFPDDIILEPLRLLDKYELGWRAPAEMARARFLWNEQRIKKLKLQEQIRLEKEKKEEDERIRQKILRIEQEVKEEEERKRQEQIQLENERKIEEERKRQEQIRLENESKRKEVLIAFSISGRNAGERKTVTVNNVEFAFRWCPAGTFMMGSPSSENGHGSDETQHQVTLTNGFWMMETQVTQKQWKAIMGNNPSVHKGDNLPVEQVSWDDCQEFCKRCANFGLLVQLPTEAQWEYACRAGSTTAYFWGNALKGDKANCNGNYPCGTLFHGKFIESTTPVGSYEPNAWGIYDMHGNVWEWCADWYKEYPDIKKGNSWYNFIKKGEQIIDPVGPSYGYAHVLRGGSCHSYARYCRSAHRYCNVSNFHKDFLGFRCVRSITSPES